MRELFAHDAPYLLAHDETPQALAIAVLNLMQMPKAQVQQDMAMITSNYSLLKFTNSWRTFIYETIG